MKNFWCSFRFQFFFTIKVFIFSKFFLEFRKSSFQPCDFKANLVEACRQSFHFWCWNHSTTINHFMSVSIDLGRDKTQMSPASINQSIASKLMMFPLKITWFRSDWQKVTWVSSLWNSRFKLSKALAKFSFLSLNISISWSTDFAEAPAWGIKNIQLQC